MRTFSARIPASTLLSSTKVLIMRPAPISSTRARAISATTSVPRIRLRRLFPVSPRLPSFNVSLTSSRDAPKAGANPAIIPTASDRNRVNASTVASIDTVSKACVAKVERTSVTNPSIPQYANSRPTAPPAKPTIALSVMSCRISRSRPAPRAARTTSSLCLPAVRAKNRLATLAQAISRTNPTALEKIISAGRKLMAQESRNESTRTPVSLL